MQISPQIALRYFLLSLIILGVVLGYYFHLHTYLTIANLKKYHHDLNYWTQQHYLLSTVLFMLTYILIVALSIPGTLFLNITGGYLFGPVAILYVLFSATIGATIIFLAVRTALGEWLASKAQGWIATFEKGFLENAFNYLLMLRFLPIIPFFIVNVVAGLLIVPTRTFISATFLGIIPLAAFYVYVGNTLKKLFETNQTPQLIMIMNPYILLPLIILALLAIFPVIYKSVTGQHFLRMKSHDC